jgi:deaminated glutathione amidase
MFRGFNNIIRICHSSRSPNRIAVVCLIMHSTSVLKSRAMSTTAKSVRPRIAVGQLCSTSSKWDNLLHIAMCAGWSSHSGCSMLFLPECAGFLGLNAEETLRAAEPSISKSNPVSVNEILSQFVQECSSLNLNEIPRNSPSIDVLKEDEYSLSLVDAIRTIAIASNLWISAGSIHMVGGSAEDPRVHNTHFIIDNTGKIRAEYRKIHLFDVCIPGKVDLRESKTTLAGNELVVCPDSPIGTSLMLSWSSRSNCLQISLISFSILCTSST